MAKRNRGYLGSGDRKRKLNIKVKIYANQDGKCYYCNTFVPFKKITVDHIVPLSKGGNSRQENIVLACMRCNGEKGDSCPTQDMTIANPL